MQAHPIPKSPKTRSAPQASTSTFDLNYLPHPSKTDSNLLILFHGIGDNENNFSNLAKTLQNTLPQTSVLVLRGGKTVPMFPDAYSWWQSFDQLGEAVTNPNPTAFLTSFNKLIDYLKTPTSKGGIGWRASCIHLFGFGQGGSAALEGAISWTRNQRRGGKEPSASSAKIEETTKSSNSLGEEKTMEKELGSIVSVSGGLLSHLLTSRMSYLERARESSIKNGIQLLSIITLSLPDFFSQHPTFSPPLSTPIFIFHRSQDFHRTSLPSIKKAFSNVTEQKSTSKAGMEMDESMPRGDEWGLIMRFWSKFIRNRNRWEIEGEGSEEVYEVRSG